MDASVAEMVHVLSDLYGSLGHALIAHAGPEGLVHHLRSAFSPSVTCVINKGHHAAHSFWHAAVPGERHIERLPPAHQKA